MSAGAERVYARCILTTIVAFSPMFFVPGTWGKIFRIFPAVVIIVLSISLLESLYILPAHLAHLPPGRSAAKKRGAKRGGMDRLHGLFGGLLERVGISIYAPLVRRAVTHRWVTLAVGLAVLMVLASVVADWEEAELVVDVMFDDGARGGERLVVFAELVDGPNAGVIVG